MGAFQHHAIIVSSDDLGYLNGARSLAQTIFPHVSEIVPGTMNGYVSFFIPPDGSREGWEASDAGDARRIQFIAWLEQSGLEWVGVTFGEYGAGIVAASDG